MIDTTTLVRAIEMADTDDALKRKLALTAILAMVAESLAPDAPEKTSKPRLYIVRER